MRCWPMPAEASRLPCTEPSERGATVPLRLLTLYCLLPITCLGTVVEVCTCFAASVCLSVCLSVPDHHPSKRNTERELGN
ncbi:hypothetical protein LX32DRAFT_15715 [Colletotrichum zoysiae]|uniref:Uncharacterized protein n=1 Tax=Colletotrichum zoysiae TaxID=1216348 RepID=A0AAD9HCY9_9PEZI|nr:hypothetical protein LX32DRAFT_15715 [Colletotrichum zoysiae]